jgi:hypothetical protein
MKQLYDTIALIFLLQGMLISCNSNSKPKKELSKEEGFVQKTSSSFVDKKSAYSEFLKKFKSISFDTLKVDYDYEDETFLGMELSAKEARFLPVTVYESYNGGLSGIFACYRFQMDSTTLGLVARTPSEYESSSLKLFFFDMEKDRISDNYIELSETFGDAGESLFRASWLFKTKSKEIQSFTYTHQSSEDIDDTTGLSYQESSSYTLIRFKKDQYDIISTNEKLLKKRFKRELKKYTE